MTQLDATHRSTRRPTRTDPATEHAARLAVCHLARDRADAVALLEALGLVDEHGKPCSPGETLGDVVTCWRD